MKRILKLFLPRKDRPRVFWLLAFPASIIVIFAVWGNYPELREKGKEELVVVEKVTRIPRLNSSRYEITLKGSQNYQIDLRRPLKENSEIWVLVEPKKKYSKQDIIIGRKEDSLIKLIYQNNGVMIIFIPILFLYGVWGIIKFILVSSLASAYLGKEKLKKKKSSNGLIWLGMRRALFEDQLKENYRLETESSGMYGTEYLYVHNRRSSDIIRFKVFNNEITEIY